MSVARGRFSRSRRSQPRRRRLLPVRQVLGRLPDGRADGPAAQPAGAAGADRAASSARCEARRSGSACPAMTCSTRCPKSVDCAGVMDALRQLAVEQGDGLRRQRLRTVLFQQAFLDNIRRNGRLSELELIGAFKTKAFLEDWSVPAAVQGRDAGAAADEAREVPPARREGHATAASCGGSSNGAVRSQTSVEAEMRTGDLDRGHRLLSRMCAARVVERLRAVGARLPGGAGRRSCANWTTGSAAGRRPPIRSTTSWPSPCRRAIWRIAERDGFDELLAPCPMCSMELIKARQRSGRRRRAARARCPRSSN